MALRSDSANPDLDAYDEEAQGSPLIHQLTCLKLQMVTTCCACATVFPHTGVSVVGGHAGTAGLRTRES